MGAARRAGREPPGRPGTVGHLARPRRGTALPEAAVAGGQPGDQPVHERAVRGVGITDDHRQRGGLRGHPGPGERRGETLPLTGEPQRDRAAVGELRAGDPHCTAQTGLGDLHDAPPRDILSIDRRASRGQRNAPARGPRGVPFPLRPKVWIPTARRPEVRIPELWIRRGAIP
ncbi:hypothetical protein SDC9_135424 [bioreactor metagenome]|uniref:Uncharacterized protein n=1 Tax=bioreactor metagenome TaxID=1076179 RepID=A0A645DI99_9ZZZZ